MTEPQDTTQDTIRWVRRGVAIAALCIGWLFIAWQNRFYISAPVVFVCLAYLALVAAVYNLWRTGVSAVDAAEDGADSTWAKPAGELGELEREKRTLLKAIKEAEFDHQMGKLSDHDADEMIRGYRARAIEVIKEIDRLGLGAAGSVREQILREVRARIQLDARSAKAGRKAQDGKAAGKAEEAKAAAKAGDAKAAAAGGKPGAEPAGDTPAGKSSDGGAAVQGQSADGAAQAGQNATGAAAPAAAVAATFSEAATAKADAAAAGASGSTSKDARVRPTVPRDEELDADSTTAFEPRQDDPVVEGTVEGIEGIKEATP